MTTLENRPNTALLVIDVQNGVVADAHERDAVVANVGRLVERARREQIPVVWVQHNDEGLARESEDWRIVPELAPDDTEPLVEKSYGDSFEDTDLESLLAERGVVPSYYLRYFYFHDEVVGEEKQRPSRAAEVAAIERGDRRAMPQMPCPEVQPLPSRVPKPTRRPPAMTVI